MKCLSCPFIYYSTLYANNQYCNHSFTRSFIQLFIHLIQVVRSIEKQLFTGVIYCRYLEFHLITSSFSPPFQLFSLFGLVHVFPIFSTLFFNRFYTVSSSLFCTVFPPYLYIFSFSINLFIYFCRSLYSSNFTFLLLLPRFLYILTLFYIWLFIYLLILNVVHYILIHSFCRFLLCFIHSLHFLIYFALFIFYLLHLLLHFFLCFKLLWMKVLQFSNFVLLKSAFISLLYFLFIFLASHLFLSSLYLKINSHDSKCTFSALFSFTCPFPYLFVYLFYSHHFWWYLLH